MSSEVLSYESLVHAVSGAVVSRLNSFALISVFTSIIEAIVIAL